MALQAADWLAQQRQEHWKNAVSRACQLFEHFDALMEGGESIRPGELRLLADVLEKADTILRRNLPAQ